MKLADYSLQFMTASGLGKLSEENAVVRQWRVLLVYTDNGEAKVVGELDARTIVPCEGFSTSDACQQEGDDLGEVGELFFDCEDGFLKDSLDLCRGGGGLLWLDVLKIDKEHRGHGLGLKVLWHAIHVLGNGCDIAVCKPWPQSDTEEKLNDTEVARGRKKLAAYWSRLGFEQFEDEEGETDMFIMDLGVKNPSFNQVMRTKKTR